MTASELTVAVLFCIWGTVSALCQHRTRFSRACRNYDTFALIPSWTFFAPNPVTADHYLYYRDHSPSYASEWKRAFDSDPRRTADWLWGPLRREHKVVSDAMFHLLDLTEILPQGRVHFSMPYLVVLAYVDSLPHDDSATATQFLFCAKREAEPIKPLFLSSIHALNPR